MHALHACIAWRAAATAIANSVYTVYNTVHSTARYITVRALCIACDRVCLSVCRLSCVCSLCYLRNSPHDTEGLRPRSHLTQVRTRVLPTRASFTRTRAELVGCRGERPLLEYTQTCIRILGLGLVLEGRVRYS